MNPFTLTNFLYDGVPLDLVGTRDAEDCWATRIYIAGTKHDLFDMLLPGVIERICTLADAQLTREAVEQNAESSAERHAFNRFVSVL